MMNRLEEEKKLPTDPTGSRRTRERRSRRTAAYNYNNPYQRQNQEVEMIQTSPYNLRSSGSSIPSESMQFPSRLKKSSNYSSNYYHTKQKSYNPFQIKKQEDKASEEVKIIKEKLNKLVQYVDETNWIFESDIPFEGSVPDTI